MSEPIKMPALGESVTEGTVTTWLKNVGDTVAEDEPLLEVATDKVDTEVPSPFSGVLTSIEVREDETVAVGTVLGYIGDSAEATTPEPPAADEAPATDEAPAAENNESEPAAATQAPAAEAPAADGIEVKMPALGESVTEGTITNWLKQVGDEVSEDEPLLEVATDKVDTEVPAPASGVLSEIRVSEDETVAVGTVVALIGSAAATPAPAPTAEPAEPVAAPEPPAAAVAAPTAPKPPSIPEAPKSAPAQSVYVTPIVRKLAQELDVDLESVTGSGVGGRIRRQDVEAAAAAAKSAAEQAAAATAPTPTATTQPAESSVKKAIADKAQAMASLRGTRQKMSGLRRTIAKRMVESLEVSAQLTTVMEVDVTRIVALRNKAKDAFLAREGVKLTYLPFFVEAATEALKAHPIINCSVEGNEIVYHDAEHVGIAVDTEKGLFVPVIRNAGNLNLAGISKSIADLAARTRDSKISPDELSGSTFTITNTGSIGAVMDTPIINQPNVAILGTGVIFRAPGVVKDEDGNETISIRSKCYLCLSYDHRVVDGADASRYLRDVKMRLEEADFASELGL